MSPIFVQLSTLYVLAIHAIIDSHQNVNLTNKVDIEFLTASIDCIKKVLAAEDINKPNVLIKAKYLQHWNFISSLMSSGTVSLKIFTDLDRKVLVPGMFMWQRTSALLFVENEHDVLNYIVKLEKQKYINSRGYFFVIPVSNKTNINYDSIGRTLLKYRVINSLVFKSSPQGIRIISNFPYRNKQCDTFSPLNDIDIAMCFWNGSFRFIREYNPHDYYPVFVTSRLFPAKIPRNLEGCPVRIITGLWPPNVIDVKRYKNPGIEIDFINMISKFMNFTPKYLYINDIVGKKSANGSWTGFMGYLERNDADIAIGSIHLDLDRQFIFEQSYWYLNNFILWIIPVASKNRKLEFLAYLVIESSVITKLGFAFSFYAVVFGSFLISSRKDTKELKQFGKFGLIHFTLIKIWLSQPIEKLPKLFKIRWIIGAWILFCTIFAFALQTSITSFLTAPFSPREINSLEETLKSGLEISYEKNYDYIVQEHKLGEHIISINKGFPAMKNLQLVAKGKAFTIVDKLRTIYMAQQWMREDGHIPILTLKKYSQHFDWVQIVMTDRYFLFDWINALVTKAGNNGFWNFMVNRYITQRKIMCSIRQRIVYYNYITGRNNLHAINKYNDGVYDAFPQNALAETVNRIFYPTPLTEEELIDNFNVKIDEGRITFEELGTVFRMLWAGYIISSFVFLLEFAYRYFQNNICPKMK